MYQATINPNTSSSLPTSPPLFTPPDHAVWVNALWFLSLVISITCALLATLLQQWARRYLKVTQPRYSPHKRARIRAFFAEGVDKFLLPWAVEALPTMLHLSLFLFFAGLGVFLWNVNLTIFKLVLSWVGLCTALYGCITLVPIFRHDSPYHTPLSLPVWHFVTGISYLTFRALLKFPRLYHFSRGTYRRIARIAGSYRESLVQGMRKTAEETALCAPPEIVTRAFLWTFDSLDEDHELERFFAGLPGFRGSKMVQDPLPLLNPEQQGKILNALIGLSDRTSSSDLLPELVKIQRTVICRKAIGLAGIPDANHAIRCVFYKFVSEEHVPVQSAEIAYVVKRWDNSERGETFETTMMMLAIVSSVVVRAQRRDALWFHLAADEMRVLETDLRNHATHGNNLSLAILIHVVRQQFSIFVELDSLSSKFSTVIEAASKFDVLGTSPELQHEFCALWNKIIRNRRNPWWILRPIRNIYLTLHLHSDSAPTTAFDASTDDEDFILSQPSSYPLCNIPGHHPDSTPRIHDAATPTAFVHSDLHDNAALDPSSLSSTPDVPSPSLPAPVHVDDNTVDAPLSNNHISDPASSHSAHQPAAENLSDSATPSDPPATGAARDMDTSARTMPLICITSDTSTLTASVFPTGENSLQNITDVLVHSSASEIPSPASPGPVLDDIMGQSLSTTLS
jgi:hypothetical protein